MVLASQIIFEVGHDKWFSLLIYKTHEVDITNPVTYSDVIKALRNILTDGDPFQNGGTLISLSPALNANRDFIPGDPALPPQHVNVYCQTFHEFYDEPHAYVPATDYNYYKTLLRLVAEFAAILHPMFTEQFFKCYYAPGHFPASWTITTRHTWHFPVINEQMTHITSDIAAFYTGGQAVLLGGVRISPDNNIFYTQRLAICYALHIFISFRNKDEPYHVSGLRLSEPEKTMLYEIIAAQARVQAAKTRKWLPKILHANNAMELNALTEDVNLFRTTHCFLAQGFNSNAKDEDDYEDEYY